MIVLADNDLVLKLAQCDLFDCLSEVLTCEIEEIYLTEAAPYQLIKNEEKALERCGNTDTFQRLQDFLDNTKTIPVIENIDLLSSLAEVYNIDAGEQLLFASSVENPDSLLMTGDKRSLQAVDENRAQIQPVFDALNGNVVTFETVLLLSLEHLGFPALKQRLLANPSPDGMLKLVLSEDMTEESLLECLCSYSRDILPFLAFQDRLPAELTASQ